ncbi:MAG TPA: APC family permease [Gemmatimonadales bacterium]|nr:APC family permease [Gemmatimonadales bacterium]
MIPSMERAETPGAVHELPRVMRLRDVVLFNITAIVGLRWLTTAGRIGPASLGLWVLAMVIFFLPSAAAVRELTDIDAGEGGIYRWVTRAFGPRHGFLAAWGYWVNNLVYYPSLLFTSAAIAAYIGGAAAVPLAENGWFVAAFSLGSLWIALGMNLVGLRVGKWVQNLGAYGTWVPAAIFVALAAWSLARHGSATAFTARALVPRVLDLPVLSLFATMTFAFAGLELAPTLGDEIVDPVATLRRGVALSGLGIVVTYILGTAAMLVALPAATVSVTNGLPQATAALADRLGAPWLTPAAALVAALATLANLGGVGAWIAGTARIPFVAGLAGVLPASFGKVHPRWRTPHVALLVQGGVATLFVAAGLVGANVRDAYLTLVDTTIVLYFLPYLYLFAAYLRLRRRRDAASGFTGWLGLGAVALSIALAFVPAPDVTRPLIFEIKLIGGVIVFMGTGLALARRGVRRATAPTGDPS